MQLPETKETTGREVVGLLKPPFSSFHTLLQLVHGQDFLALLSVMSGGYAK